MLDPPQKIITDTGKQNLNKYYHYHEGKVHNTSECRAVVEVI